MGTILRFEAPPQSKRRERREVPEEGGMVVIFPGVRIDRSDIDLSARVRTQPEKTRKEIDPATWR